MSEMKVNKLMPSENFPILLQLSDGERKTAADLTARYGLDAIQRRINLKEERGGGKERETFPPTCTSVETRRLTDRVKV